MANLLDDYRKKQEEMKMQVAEGDFVVNFLMEMQELNYRIYVLETLQFFCKSAPVTEDMTQIGIHYQIMSTIVRSLLKEHTLGVKADEELKKKRETARGNLEAIIQDTGRQFNSFQMTAPDIYKRCVSSTINSVLAAWIQYRNTYVNL